MPYFKSNTNYIMVSTQFIKDKTPHANPTFVKVYLYLLMLASENTQKEYSEIASTLGLLESDLMQAINYWIGQGELFKNGDLLSFEPAISNDTPVIPSQTQSNFSVSQGSQEPVRHLVPNIAEIISNDQGLSDMFMIAQEILGKTIPEKDMQTIYWFHSDLEMPIEVILLLLEYCVSKGKNRMSYIEKVAISWKELGLNTSESVTAYLKDEEQKTGFLYSIRKIMGISDRSLSQIEEKYLTKWHEEFNMSEEMIALAYEYCIIQTAKLSFPYMDKIITRWNSQGITTIQDAEEDNRKFKNRSKQEETIFSPNKYDHDDLEKLSRN